VLWYSPKSRLIVENREAVSLPSTSSQPWPFKSLTLADKMTTSNSCAMQSAKARLESPALPFTCRRVAFSLSYLRQSSCQQSFYTFACGAPIQSSDTKPIVASNAQNKPHAYKRYRNIAGTNTELRELWQWHMFYMACVGSLLSIAHFEFSTLVRRERSIGASSISIEQHSIGPSRGLTLTIRTSCAGGRHNMPPSL